MEKLHVQPTELDMLPYYEFEYTLELYNEIIKELSLVVVVVKL
jgi:hypothetical protein